MASCNRGGSALEVVDAKHFVPVGVADRDGLAGRRDGERPDDLDAGQAASVGQRQYELSPGVATRN